MMKDLRIGKHVWAAFCALMLAFAGPPVWAQQAVKPLAVEARPDGKAFRSPQAAAAALYAAARRNDENQLLVILGPESKDVVDYGDAREQAARRQQFADKYDQMHRLVKEPDGTVALYVGAANWPLPIPLVEYQGYWYFYTAAGRQEIFYRRIGRNEMEALEVGRNLVDAEKDYQATEHRYTDKFVSAEGAHDGLYWRGPGQGKSPIGPYLANAGMTNAGTGDHEPFHGYFYRIVLRGRGQTQGFVVVAYPAEYRVSGVMTFIVDSDGTAVEKDLGRDTATAAASISSSPDNTWKKVE